MPSPTVAETTFQPPVMTLIGAQPGIDVGRIVERAVWEERGLQISVGSLDQTLGWLDQNSEGSGAKGPVA